MKKLVMSTLLCGALLGSLASSSMTAFAADGGAYTTGAVIQFEENDEPINPVDPEEPGIPVDPIDPIDPEKPVQPGTPGPLSIDYVSSLNFGKQKITSVDKTYYAAAQKVTDGNSDKIEDRTNYIQISDNRGDSLGWKLSVKQNSQFKTAEGQELKGAKISFMNGQLASAMDSKKPSTVVENFDLTANGTGAMSDVLAAEEGEGAGTWIYRFGDESNRAESIKLEIPGNTTKLKDQKYSTEIIWTLTDVPENNGGEELK